MATPRLQPVGAGNGVSPLELPLDVPLAPLDEPVEPLELAPPLDEEEDEEDDELPDDEVVMPPDEAAPELPLADPFASFDASGATQSYP